MSTTRNDMPYITHANDQKGLTSIEIAAIAERAEIAEKDKTAAEKVESLRISAQSKNAISIDDVPMEYRTNFSEMLRVPEIASIITSYTSFGDERKAWITAVKDFTAELFRKEFLTYRNPWGARAYNCVYVPLGAGLNDVDYRVSSCNAKMFQYLNCCYNIKYLEKTNEKTLLTDCSSHLINTCWMTPFNSLFSLTQFLFITLPTGICCPCCTNTNASCKIVSCCCLPIENGDEVKFRNYKGFNPDRYACNCDYKGRSSYLFVPNNILTDCLSITGMPLLNVCCASTACCGAYTAGALKDCIEPERYRYITAEPNQRISISLNECIVIKTNKSLGLKLLRDLHVNAAFIRHDGKLYYCNLPYSHDYVIPIDIAEAAITVFDNEFKPTDKPRTLREEELKRVNSITGFNHADAANSELIKEYLDERKAALKRINNHLENILAMLRPKMTRDDDKANTSSNRSHGVSQHHYVNNEFSPQRDDKHIPHSASTSSASATSQAHFFAGPSTAAAASPGDNVASRPSWWGRF